jgi:hypothetical protein
MNLHSRRLRAIQGYPPAPDGSGYGGQARLLGAGAIPRSRGDARRSRTVFVPPASRRLLCFVPHGRSTLRPLQPHRDRARSAACVLNVLVLVCAKFLNQAQSAEADAPAKKWQRRKSNSPARRRRYENRARPVRRPRCRSRAALLAILGEFVAEEADEIAMIGEDVRFGRRDIRATAQSSVRAAIRLT